ncbi:chaplin [Streptomyces sp. NBC_01754]|nr:chaplin [Streptomyces sp. NBC_01754]WSC97010.1 chaplin [Streptomyces sp. NBC_01754]
MALGAAAPAMADAGAEAAAVGSPGVLSGNVLQVPIHIPVNVCGNSINVIGLLNPAFGNACVNS